MFLYFRRDATILKPSWETSITSHLSTLTDEKCVKWTSAVVWKIKICAEEAIATPTQHYAAITEA
jgi:hypothetical protein